MIKTLLSDEHFWIYLSFITFIAIFGKFLYTKIYQMLMDAIQAIKDRINGSISHLEKSQRGLEGKKFELSLLNNRISQKFKSDKNYINNLNDIFFESLSCKLSLLRKNFSKYEQSAINKKFSSLYKQLIDEVHTQTLKHLNQTLTKEQKDIIMQQSIKELDSLNITK